MLHLRNRFLCLAFFGLGLVREGHYESVTYRVSSGVFVYRVLDDNTMDDDFLAIPNRNRNLIKTKPK
jgi:hypothetical protein